LSHAIDGHAIGETPLYLGCRGAWR
jgi:hypothetical protein